MIGAFQFVDGGRTYRCRVETPAARGGAAPVSWWWFEVSGDQNRYAPFHAQADDTESSVKERVVAYYQQLLVRRAEPARAWHNRPRPRTDAPAAPSAPVPQS